MTIASPGNPLFGKTSVIVTVTTWNGISLDQAPPCSTWAFPDREVSATVATTCVSLQLTTVPQYVLPSHTCPSPIADPKPVPEMVIVSPGAPVDAERLVMAGGFVTVKAPPLPDRPFTVTTTLPVAAPLGTVTVMLVSLQYGAVPALAPPKVTVLVPWLAPKLAPVMVTAIPTGPKVGHTLVIFGGVATVKSVPLLAMPPTVTTTLPVLAPPGTCTTMLVSLQLDAVPATVPLKATVLVALRRAEVGAGDGHRRAHRARGGPQAGDNGRACHRKGGRGGCPAGRGHGNVGGAEGGVGSDDEGGGDLRQADHGHAADRDAGVAGGHRRAGEEVGASKGYGHTPALNAARRAHGRQRRRRRTHGKCDRGTGPARSGHRNIGSSEGGVDRDGERGRKLCGADHRHTARRDPRVTACHGRTGDEVGAGEGDVYTPALNARLAGLTEMSVGVGGFTVKFAGELAPPLVITTMLTSPSAAPEDTVNVAVICVALTTVNPLTAIAELLIASIAPGTKLVPLRVTDTLAPWAPTAGADPSQRRQCRRLRSHKHRCGDQHQQ